LIKVLHFFKTYYPQSMGGVEQVIFQLAEGGRRFGFESEVLSLSSEGSSRNTAMRGHVVHTSKLDVHIASTGFSLSAFRDFSELAEAADIINYHFPWPFMDVVHFISRINKPTVLSYHSDIVKQKALLRLYHPLMYRFLDKMDCIIASSPNYIATSPTLQRYKEKVVSIPIGLDRSTYPAVPDDVMSNWRNLLGERFFLFVGALRYYKGLEFLLDAAVTCPFPIVILGQGPMEGQLKAKAFQLGLTNVRFLGGLPDVDKTALLKLCTGMVFPSHLRSEAFGISLLEAAMFGKPMVSCEIGSGTTYININGETGVVVPPSNANELSAAMRFLWSNTAEASAMGKKALARFERLFTADAMVSSYSDVYYNLLK